MYEYCLQTWTAYSVIRNIETICCCFMLENFLCFVLLLGNLLCYLLLLLLWSVTKAASNRTARWTLIKLVDHALSDLFFLMVAKNRNLISNSENSGTSRWLDIHPWASLPPFLSWINKPDESVAFGSSIVLLI